MVGNMEDFRKESWSIRPMLDVPDLFPPAVMFSILDFDPRTKFRDRVNRMSETQNQQRLEPIPPVSPQLVRQSLLSAAWDSVFRDVPGDTMGLLFCRNAAQSAKTEVDDQSAPPVVRAHMVGFMSTEPVGTKWVVTRAARCGDKPVCWCKPVEVEKGKIADVQLTEQDMIDLESL